MRIKTAASPRPHSDLTPMIDMTFQLIAFFMVLINFTEAEQDQRIQLPSSILAKPPEAPLEDPITLQLMKNGEVVVFGDTITLDSLPSYLIREGEALELADKKRQDATIIIRADAGAATGQVQEMIKICQDARFEQFALRAKEAVDY